MSNTTSGSESFIEDIHRPSDGAGLRHMKWIQKAVHLLRVVNMQKIYVIKRCRHLSP